MTTKEDKREESDTEGRTGERGKEDGGGEGMECERDADRAVSAAGPKSPATNSLVSFARRLTRGRHKLLCRPESEHKLHPASYDAQLVPGRRCSLAVVVVES